MTSNDLAEQANRRSAGSGGYVIGVGNLLTTLGYCVTAMVTEQKRIMTVTFIIIGLLSKPTDEVIPIQWTSMIDTQDISAYIRNGEYSHEELLSTRLHLRGSRNKVIGRTDGPKQCFRFAWHAREKKKVLPFSSL